ncbi:hypothetical protein [Burkholderia ambifaria]|uniref:hypothetical protein n=1 Tax=Burkholderia ambifaria TaxID=152480 RepID=UPI00315C9FE5
MAASEAAIAASHIAAVAAQAPVTAANQAWFALAGTVCGALITAGAALLNQRLTRGHEQQKLAAQRAPAQLDAAIVLEAFARRAATHLDAVEERIFGCLAEEHGETAQPEREWEELVFDVSLISDRAALPIEILSPCLELPTLLTESRAWIDAVSKEDWPSPLDLYQLDAQRAVLYGLLASEWAGQIRDTIEAPASSLATECFERLQREFKQLSDQYVTSAGNINVIPDLKARLQREFPTARNKPGPALASVRH